MRNKFKIDKQMISRHISESDREATIKRTKLMQYLGIDIYYDESHTIDKESYIPSMYKTLADYEADKFNAKLLIMSNKTVPKEQFNRLLDARKELEQKGILETIT